MKWGDRGVGISRLWDPCASTAHLPDVCGGRQFEAPRWVERAADGTTVEVDDRSPSVAAGSGPASPAATGTHPLFRLPAQMARRATDSGPVRARRIDTAAPAAGHGATPPAEGLTDAERRRQVALQHLRDNQKQASLTGRDTQKQGVKRAETAEKERRQREERERAAREEAALDEHIRRQNERERQTAERQRLATAERRAAAERRQMLVTEAIRKAEQEAAAEKRRRLRGAAGDSAATTTRREEPTAPVASSTAEPATEQTAGGGAGDGNGGTATTSHRLTSRPSNSSSGESESSRPTGPSGRARLSPLQNRRRSEPAATEDRLGSGRQPLPGLGRLYIEDRVLTPTKYRGDRTSSGCEFGTQTEPGRRQMPAELVQRRDVTVGTETPPTRHGRRRERSKARARPLKIEDRPRWNAPQPEKVYLKQTEKDLLVSRGGARRRRERQLRNEDESCSDTDTGPPDWSGEHRASRDKRTDTNRSGVSEWRNSRTVPRYRSHSPLKARVAAYYAASSDGKFSSSSSSRAAARALGSSVPLITASEVLFLPEYGNVALVPLSQPHLAYLSHAHSLPLLAAAGDIPVYPPVSTEKALRDIGSRVVSAVGREAAQSPGSTEDAPDGGADGDTERAGGPPARRRSRRDNGTDKEDEEPPHLYNKSAGAPPPVHKAQDREDREEEGEDEEEEAIDREDTGSEHSSGSQERSEAADTADGASRDARDGRLAEAE
ncbi:hypothetical protein FJT64_016231 [Amphibalanus amphitrite]|uniref:Uncharacterized protein n=1 Tax=Amphibalanus amphitrite TaxID=1232801 RepID=A0A6A4XFB5_AMPAM|nr:hypothetical protein FJT64_016231 [Amphibalanus amphitrite]